MASLWLDLRYAVRQFGRRPLLCAAAIFSLALGIGANTTIFSFANALLLRLPAISHPGNLAEVYTHNPDPNAAFGGLYPLSYLDYLDIRKQTQAFSDIAIYDPLATVSMVYGNQRATLGGELVSGNFFSLLGVPMALGRGIEPDEAATPGTSAVVVLGYQTWQRELGGDRDIVGKKILLNQVPYTVVGVAGSSFDGVITGLQCDFYAPVTMADRTGAPGMLVRNSRTMFGVGRLRPGETLASATADLTVVQKRLDGEYPNDDKAQFTGLALPFGSEPAFFRGEVAGANVLLMVIVGLVLLIACFNAANVLLVQAYGRRREWAVRAALGASRARLLRQGLTESVLLAVVAGGLGIEIARILGPLLLQMKPPGFPLALNFQLDPHVLIFTAALALGTGLLFGLVPAWQAAKIDVIDGLRAGASIAGITRGKMRQALIAGQIAVCVIVLLGAALCLRSLQHANAIDPGFDTDHMVFADIDANGLGYRNAAARQYVEHVEDELARMPGVDAVAGAMIMPLSIVNMQTDVLVPGMQAPPGKLGVTVDAAVVGPNYFHASGTRLLRGTDFTRAQLPSAEEERRQPPGIPKNPDYVVVNEAMAQHFWPQQDPLGRALLFEHSDGFKRATVVGVAQNGKYRSLGEPTRMFVFELAPVESGAILVHTTGPADDFVASVRGRMMDLDPNLTRANVTTARDALSFMLFPVRATSLLLIGFGTLALLLALVGLYAVIAASVAQRTREFGVRMAMGAAPRQVLAGVLREGLRLALWGIAAGLVLSAIFDRVIAGLLYGISALDPIAYFATAAVLTAVALAAAYLPARRAAGIDPMAALREE